MPDDCGTIVTLKTTDQPGNQSVSMFNYFNRSCLCLLNGGKNKVTNVQRQSFSFMCKAIHSPALKLGLAQGKEIICLGSLPGHKND